MTADDFKFIKFMNVETSRFSFWIVFKDSRNNNYGKRARKELIEFFTSILGPLGERWEYSKDSHTFTIKLNEGIDATMFALKYCKV
jgi:hypothetical protein